MFSKWASPKFRFFVMVNPLLNDKILDQSKMKDLADNKINMTQKLNFVGVTSCLCETLMLQKSRFLKSKTLVFDHDLCK